MKIFFVTCLILALSCSAFGAEENHALVVRSGRGLMEQSVRLIENLVANLQRAANEALDAVGNFTSGVVREAEAIRDKILNDIERFRTRVSEAIENVFQRFSNTSTALRECVDSHRTQAATLFDESVSHTMTCVDDRIADISAMIEQLRTQANNAIAEANAALGTMKNCTLENTNLVNTGSCLGLVAVQTELKSVSFLTQNTILVGRINLAISTLPATLEMCAGSHLIQTGVNSGKIILEIGSCSANAVFSNITG